MTQYSYKARNNAGALVTGQMTGNSVQEIINQLRAKEYTPVKITEAGTPEVKKKTTSFLSANISFGPAKVKPRDLMILCTNLSSMTDAGIPLLNALNVTSEQLTNPYLTDIVRKVSQKISEGSSFSESLALFPKVFSNFFVNMIRSGEISGTLAKVLRDMAVFLEKQDNMRQTIKGMMVYPIVLLTACIGIVVLIITFLLPQFVQIFTRANVPLPLPTRILYAAGLWIKHYPFYYIPGLIGVFFSVRLFLQTSGGKNFFDHWVLELPLVGSLIKKILVARFCRTLGAMLDTGVPLLQSFKILQQILENTVFVAIVGEIYTSVEKGEGIHPALMARREFPRDVTYMISVGESTGNLGMMLNKVADFYESKVQFQVKELMVLVEPAFIAIMGIVVGVIMASIILPMFEMVKTIQR
jgi:type IV pilus assembly protein PilC